MKTYRLLVYMLHDEDKISWRGHQLSKDKPTFIRTEEVLDADKLFNIGIACKEYVDDIPKTDMLGEDIKVNALKGGTIL